MEGDRLTEMVAHGGSTVFLFVVFNQSEKGIKSKVNI